MPLECSEWAKGKCSFKLIQYGAIGIPAVASNGGMNSEVIINGKNGFLVNNKKEWYDKLEILINDYQLRKKMGIFNRSIVEKKYSIQRYLTEYFILFDKIIEE